MPTFFNETQMFIIVTLSLVVMGGAASAGALSLPRISQESLKVRIISMVIMAVGDFMLLTGTVGLFMLLTPPGSGACMVQADLGTFTWVVGLIMTVGTGFLFVSHFLFTKGEAWYGFMVLAAAYGLFALALYIVYAASTCSL